MYKKACCPTTTVSLRCSKLFRKQESRKEKECANCCSRLLKKSLITGFVEIAKSKRFHRRVGKLLVFCICTTGFFYQTWAFLQIYLAYPIAQDTKEEYPEAFMAPALTICNNNRLFRQRACTTFPDGCNGEDSTWEQFCDAHRRQCTDQKTPDFNKAFPNFNVWFRENREAFVINTIGPYKESDLILSCNISGRNVDCRSRIIQVGKSGFPYNCISLFSLLGKQNEEPFNVSYTDDYFIKIQMRPEEFFDDNDLVQTWVFLHDPRKVVNAMTEGVILPGGKLYNLFPTMETRVTLPPPYTSKCMDYLKEWKKNGGYGPISKKDCIDQCIIEAMYDEYLCVGKYITYPNNYTICDHSAAASAEMMIKCTSICPDACEENIYRFTSEMIGEASPECSPEDEYCKNRYTTIEVKFTRMMVQTSQHVPRFESIELFSYIGGYLGMWLGISLASTFDFVEMIYDTLYPFLKGKRKQQKTKSIEKCQHRLRKKKKQKT